MLLDFLLNNDNHNIIIVPYSHTVTMFEFFRNTYCYSSNHFLSFWRCIWHCFHDYNNYITNKNILLTITFYDSNRVICGLGSYWLHLQRGLRLNHINYFGFFQSKVWSKKRICVQKKKEKKPTIHNFCFHLFKKYQMSRNVLSMPVSKT